MFVFSKEQFSKLLNKQEEKFGENMLDLGKIITKQLMFYLNCLLNTCTHYNYSVPQILNVDL